MNYSESMIAAGRAEKVQEMRRAKMDICTSINTLMTRENSELILKIHEIIAYGFAMLEGEEDWHPPQAWTKYNDADTQRRLQEELNKNHFRDKSPSL